MAKYDGRLDGRILAVEVRAHNLPASVVVAMIGSGKFPGGVRKIAFEKLMLASEFLLRLAGWVGYGVSPFEKLEETETRTYGYEQEPSEGSHFVDDYGTA